MAVDCDRNGHGIFNFTQTYIHEDLFFISLIREKRAKLHGGDTIDLRLLRTGGFVLIVQIALSK